MPLNDIEIAWVRFLAMRDQLMAARDEENGTRRPVDLPPLTGDKPTEIDLREAVTERRRSRLRQGHLRRD
jgi:hypothetical protein